MVCDFYIIAMSACSSLRVCTVWIDSEYLSYHEKSAGISDTNKPFLEDELLENVSDGNAANSEASSDLLNDARCLFQSQDISFDLYSQHKIIYESSPIQLGGFFATLSHMIRRVIFSLLLLNWKATQPESNLLMVYG